MKVAVPDVRVEILIIEGAVQHLADFILLLVWAGKSVISLMNLSFVAQRSEKDKSKKINIQAFER